MPFSVNLIVPLADAGRLPGTDRLLRTRCWLLQGRHQERPRAYMFRRAEFVRMAGRYWANNSGIRGPRASIAVILLRGDRQLERATQ